jgi:peroxiredoxin
MLSINHKTVGATVLALLLAISSVALGQNSAGSPVEFSLRSISGQTVTAQSLRGEIVVLAFGASWLPLSRTQLQGLKKFADDNTSRGLIVFWVSTESEDPKSKNFASDDRLRAFADKYGLKITVLRDPDGATSKKFGVGELPSMVVLDKQGNAVGEPIIGIDPDGNVASQLAARVDGIR